ncbi:hypothetical protein [Thermofilum pendens]|uniref:Uncharacterized protein n=1 Tax=Thermofilum pendens (strain DSM 2475 / Hrk 5) TaxID=368408 RepID=A1RXZ6_THEPD|nr:hypothetical protein [Thermofilum pendens]ABL78076.1 hypothetical protein Tpen_0674 [Thermofilum pendens Hrk 5]
MRAVEESIFTFFELLLLVGILTYASATAPGENSLALVYGISQALPEGSCAVIMSASPLSLGNATLGKSVAVCKVGNETVVKPWPEG